MLSDAFNVLRSLDINLQLIALLNAANEKLLYKI